MKKSTFFKTPLGKAVIIFVLVVTGLSIIVFTINAIIENVFLADTPAIVKNSFESTKVAKHILRRVGEEITSEEYGFNETNPKNDTLKFHIKLVGDKAAVTINTVATRKTNQDWRIIKSDTVFTQ